MQVWLTSCAIDCYLSISPSLQGGQGSEFQLEGLSEEEQLRLALELSIQGVWECGGEGV